MSFLFGAEALRFFSEFLNSRCPVFSSSVFVGSAVFPNLPSDPVQEVDTEFLRGQDFSLPPLPRVLLSGPPSLLRFFFFLFKPSLLPQSFPEKTSDIVICLILFGTD